MGRLTTHVLDTVSGEAAAGMRIEFLEANPEGGWAHRAMLITNTDGRTDAPVMAGESFHSGRFQLRFHVAEYFRSTGAMLAEPPFLDIVPIHFGISADEHYHVPLLCSPFAYSSYRGS
jgi:5-hydroxyisourate hydrolase